MKSMRKSLRVGQRFKNTQEAGQFYCLLIYVQHNKAHVINWPFFQIQTENVFSLKLQIQI